MPTRSENTQMDEKRKHYSEPEKNYPEQLQANNMFTNDVEDPNSTNKRRNLSLTRTPLGSFLRNKKEIEEQTTYIDRAKHF